MNNNNHECGPDCTHDHSADCYDERDDVVLLIDEEGSTITFQLIGDFELDGSDYAVLADKITEDDEEMDEDVNVMVYKIVDEDGEDVLYEIEDDDEWNRVVEYWNSFEEE